jgi:hypothetical protein
MVVQESYEWDGDPGHGPTAANATPSPFQGEGRGEGDMIQITRFFPLTQPLPRGGEESDDTGHAPSNPVRLAAREFRYHSGRARYLMRDRDPETLAPLDARSEPRASALHRRATDRVVREPQPLEISRVVQIAPVEDDR